MQQAATSTTWRTAGPPGCEGDGPGALGLLPEHAPCRVLPGARRAHRGRPWARHGARHARLRGLGGVAGGPLHRLGGLPELARVEWHSVAACAGASTPSWRPRAAPRGSTACAASASTRRRTRRATGTSRWSSTTTAAAHLGARGHRQGRAQPVPRRAHARAEARHRGGDRRRREVNPRQLVRHRCPNARWVMDPLPRGQWMNDALDAVRCEEWNAARAAARAAGPGPRTARQACWRAAARRRSGRSRRRRPPSGQPLRAREEPRGPHRRPEGEAQARSRRGPARGWSGPGSSRGGPAGRLPGSRRLRRPPSCSATGCTGPPTARDVAKVVAVEEGAPPARRHHRRSRARHQQRARKRPSTTNRGDGEDGLRLPQLSTTWPCSCSRCGDCQPQLRVAR